LSLSAKSAKSSPLNKSDTLSHKNGHQENRVNSTTNSNQRSAIKTAPLSAKSTSQNSSSNNKSSNQLLPLESLTNLSSDSKIVDSKTKAFPSSAKTSKSSNATANKSSLANSSPKNDNLNTNENKKLETIIQSNKIPHPPPQSTRPTSSSARKIRLTSVVKNNSNQAVPSSQETISINNLVKKPNNSNLLNACFTNGDSSNEEDIHNSSSKTIFDYNVNANAGLIPNLVNAYSNTNLTKLNNATNNNDSSNVFNESVTDLVQILKSNMTDSNQNFRSQQQQQQLQSVESSNNFIAYSFSSKPKPLSVNSKDLNSTLTHFNNNNNNLSSANKVYDYRKYSSSTANKISTNPIPSSLPSVANVSKAALTETVTVTNLSFLKDSLNPSQSNGSNIQNFSLNNFDNNNINNNNSNLGENQSFYNDLMDSFEAQMLQHMKAEMESDSKTSSKTKTSIINSSNSNNNNSNSKANPVNKNNSKKSFANPLLPSKQETEANKKISNTPENIKQTLKVNQRSPDADYVEVMQREASGIQSPLSDDYNPTTSEKYNFDAMTSSIEDTTTSLSKKTVRKIYMPN
jgi:hypothetical protein